MDCSEFHQLLNRRLDGEWPGDPAACEQHLADCPECRTWQAAARRLEQGLRFLTPRPPPDLATQVVAQVLAEQRARLRIRRGVLAMAALAAGLLLVVLLGHSWRPADPLGAVPSPRAQVPRPPDRAAPQGPLKEKAEEAGSALVALMERTAGTTVDQGRFLLPGSGAPAAALPRTDRLPQPLEPSLRSLRATGQGLSAGLEPLTSSARRAVDWFLREIPVKQ